MVKGWGFITPNDGGQEVFVHQVGLRVVRRSQFGLLLNWEVSFQHAIQMDGFRSLGENEEVEFQCKETPKGFEATVVTGPNGAQCVGSQRNVGRKRVRKIRYALGDSFEDL